MVVMSEPQSLWPYAWLFPAIGGTAWFVTLLSLLIYWVADGRPRYPHQSNPYVAFISDIGAHHLKPLFIAGGTLTSITYIATILSANHARYDRRMHGILDVRWKKALSVLALISGVAAGIGCTLLTIYDTDKFHSLHQPFLLVTFVGIGLSAICTTIVYLDQTRGQSSSRVLRICCRISCAVVGLEILFTAAFIACAWTNHLRLAGIMEWIIAFTGAIYIWLYVGFVWPPGYELTGGSAETAPLLHRQD